MADYKGYSNNLKIVGKDIVWMGKKIGMDFGKALTERVSKDAAALGGLVKQIYGKLPFAETTKRIFANLKTMFDIFMTKPYAPFEKLTKDADELQQRLRDTRNSLMDLADAEDKAGEKASILGIEWENALRALFAPEAGNRTWVSMFTDTLKGIEGAWASTIENILNKTFDMAITFENIMESMFLNVLHQFNALVAKIAAQDLLHAMLGGKTERTPGVPSFIGLVKKLFTKTPFTPGLSVPSRGGYGESGLGHLGLQSSPKIAFNIENKGEPVNLRETGRHFDGGQLVINTIMERMDTDPNFRARFGV